ncbi:hypothetical protein C8R43DRAFT_955181 [Mycena crocata]|nr:hypothetical protein C8R43DRAFT_955181 [Mycena crocata]
MTHPDRRSSLSEGAIRIALLVILWPSTSTHHRSPHLERRNGVVECMHLVQNMVLSDSTPKRPRWSHEPNRFLTDLRERDFLPTRRPWRWSTGTDPNGWKLGSRHLNGGLRLHKNWRPTFNLQVLLYLSDARYGSHQAEGCFHRRNNDSETITGPGPRGGHASIGDSLVTGCATRRAPSSHNPRGHRITAAWNQIPATVVKGNSTRGGILPRASSSTMLLVAQVTRREMTITQGCFKRSVPFIEKTGDPTRNSQLQKSESESKYAIRRQAS